MDILTAARAEASARPDDGGPLVAMALRMAQASVSGDLKDLDEALSLAIAMGFQPLPDATPLSDATLEALAAERFRLARRPAGSVGMPSDMVQIAIMAARRHPDTVKALLTQLAGRLPGHGLDGPPRPEPVYIQAHREIMVRMLSDNPKGARETAAAELALLACDLMTQSARHPYVRLAAVIDQARLDPDMAAPGREAWGAELLRLIDGIPDGPRAQEIVHVVEAVHAMIEGGSPTMTVMKLSAHLLRITRPVVLLTAKA